MTTKKWDVKRSLKETSEYIGSLGLPTFGAPPDKPEMMAKISELGDETNEGLQRALTYYASCKAFVEVTLGNLESEYGISKAAYDASASSYSYTILTDREEAGKKKLTKDEMAGAVSRNSALKELAQTLIGIEGKIRALKGALESYTTAYSAASRNVSVRTIGQNHAF